MPYTSSVEGETCRLIASTSRGLKGGRSPAVRPWPRGARRSWSARRPSPSGARSRHPAHPPAGSRARPRRRRGTRRASRSARRPSPRARVRPAPGPRPAAASAPRPACAAPTSAAAARARLRQRGWRAPTGPRPSHPPRAFPTSSQSPNCKSVSQRTVGRGNTACTSTVRTIPHREGRRGTLWRDASYRGELRVHPADFIGWSQGSRFYPLLYMLTRTGYTRDWGTGLELKAHMLGKASSLELHRVFPKALLYKNGYEKAEVNALANFTFLTKQTNIALSDRDPA